MESKTANDVLARSYDGGHVAMENAERAVEIAMEEASEQVRRKAIMAHRACCPKNELECFHRDRDDYSCTFDCPYVRAFVKMMDSE